MRDATFETRSGRAVPAVTADQMREVDHVAVEVVGLTLIRMMEHAGRSLALQALELRAEHSAETQPVVVLAGGGGNGGGGLVCARHLSNRGIPTTVVLDRAVDEVTGVAGEQLGILQQMETVTVTTTTHDCPLPSLVVDAVLGYGVQGEPRGMAATLIEWTRSVEAPVLSLDVPSGVDATTGEELGSAVQPDRTLTLALPKTGLADGTSDLVLADLSIPGVVYESLGIPYEIPFGRNFQVDLVRR